MRALLIAEKPSLQRQIQAVYHTMSGFPDNIDFATFAGHCVGLQNPKEYGVYKGKDWSSKKWSWDMLPIIPDEFRYKVIADKQKMYRDLKNKLDIGHYDYIINACDPDREGNHIFHLFYMLTGCKLPVKRFWTNDLMESSIEHALTHLRYEGDGVLPDLKHLTEAAVLRAQFDWLCGMNFTIASSLQMHQTAKVGRVKTATLAILAKREEEIKNFKPVTTYELEVLYQEGFTGVLFDEDGNVRFKTEEDVNPILKELNPKEAVVKDLTKKKEKTNAPQLYKLSDLQVEASKYFGYNADRVLAIAQSLYEKKLLSYPRTDCRHIGTALTDKFPKLLASVACLSELKDEVDHITKKEMDQVKKNSRYVNDKELEKSGHYALVPTEVKPDFSKLPTEESNILTLVYKRFLAIFLPPMETEKTTIITENNGYTFKSNGKILLEKGWTRIYKTSSADTLLPAMKKGNIVHVKDFQTAEKVSTPPSRYTEGTLIAVMENPAKFLQNDSLKAIIKEREGIGTPATRAGIVAQLITDGYISKRKGKGKAEQIYVEPAGMLIYSNVKDKEFSSVDMTGIWEEKLSAVAEGRMPFADFDTEMREYVLNMLDDIKKTSMKTASFATTAKAIGTCPKCGKSVVVGKKYYLCEDYKNGCDFIMGMELHGAKITETEAKKLLAGKPSKEFTFHYQGRTWKKRLEIKNGQVQYEGSSKGNEIQETCVCPKCGGQMKITPHGAFCENEDVKLYRKVKDAEFTNEELLKLIEGEQVEKTFTWNNGKKSNAKCGLDEQCQFKFFF